MYRKRIQLLQIAEKTINLWEMGCASGDGPNCFLKGTTIRTVSGDRKIEDLAIGDLLPTMFGGLRPIQWIGRYPLKKSDRCKPWVKDALPVQIARSALAPNVPHADLYVTGGHSLFLDGLLVPVGNLINGTSIRRDERDCDELEFFHIKLESHDVIYAEGAPVDTLLRVNECAVNFAEYFRKYGTPETQETRCAPWVTYGGGRGEFKSRFAARCRLGLIAVSLLTLFATTWKSAASGFCDNKSLSRLRRPLRQHSA